MFERRRDEPVGMHVARAHSDDRRFSCGRRGKVGGSRGSSEAAFVLRLSSESAMQRGSAAVALRWRKCWDEQKERWRPRLCLASDQRRGVREVHVRLLVWIVYIHHSVKAK